MTNHSLFLGSQQVGQGSSLAGTQISSRQSWTAEDLLEAGEADCNKNNKFWHSSYKETTQYIRALDRHIYMHMRFVSKIRFIGKKWAYLSDNLICCCCCRCCCCCCLSIGGQSSHYSRISFLLAESRSTFPPTFLSNRHYLNYSKSCLMTKAIDCLLNRKFT